MSAVNYCLTLTSDVPLSLSLILWLSFTPISQRFKHSAVLNPFRYKIIPQSCEIHVHLIILSLSNKIFIPKMQLLQIV
jgi:hypothetical protein